MAHVDNPVGCHAQTGMRWDRFITLNVVRHLRKPFPVDTRKVTVPVLMYHNITTQTERGVDPYYRVNTAPSVFREHMEYLSRNGYRTITVTALAEAMQGAAAGSSTLQAGRPAVAITFDDGFRSLFTEALPVLREYNFSATVFLATGFVGEKTDRRIFRPAGGNRQSAVEDCRTADLECLVWEEVQEMSSAGIEFGSHTVTHPKLVDLSFDRIESEICDSRATIEHRLGKPAKSFCYPYAFPQTNRRFTEAIKTALLNAGYSSCSTTMVGSVRSSDDSMQLRRLPANSLDDCALFEAKLSGSYDWIAKPQAVLKGLRAAVR